jgi:hypothetical protein
VMRAGPSRPPISLSLRAERSNPRPVMHYDGDCTHAPALGPGGAARPTRKVAKSAVVMPLWTYNSSRADRPAARCELAMTVKGTPTFPCGSRR